MVAVVQQINEDTDEAGNYEGKNPPEFLLVFF
jgi:hypothetical protein